MRLVDLSNKIYTTILVGLCLMLSGTVSFGQSFLQTEGKSIVNEQGDTIILRGMGLGGWMLQEGYMLQTAEFANAQFKIRQHITDLIGVSDTDLFYDKWLANHVQKADIDSLAAWGFNSVRLPMHYNLFTLPIEDEPIPGEHTWLQKGFELTDSLISWCAANNMYVILDLHAAPGGQGADQGISDYDPTKPSLWESQENRNKTVALWEQLAIRYVNEPWVAGYDLLNEVNWGMSNNAPLRALYEDITEAIRGVDQSHIIFIEGNWFANDFTGLTPPWDDNMVYSPHKYWSINDQASIQWVLTLRENFDVPLYFGESGENSNLWFRDAVALMEENGIGWAWWPMKKIESISGLASVEKTPGYQSLLNYWKGQGAEPTAQEAKDILFDLTEKLKIENCRIQPDVAHALIPQDTAIKPYATNVIPGLVYASDYDMGPMGEAYFDLQSATYHVSTGEYTAWNTGWAYRNDGVDIEPCSDNINTNGFNVGWIDAGEWMRYTVEVMEDGAYDLHLRTATAGFTGQVHLETENAVLTGPKYIPSTGGYQNWETTTINELVLNEGTQVIYLYADGGDFNLSSLEFEWVAAIEDINTKFLSAFTESETSIRMNVNKELLEAGTTNSEDFTIYVNGLPTPIASTSIDEDNIRSIIFELDGLMKNGDLLNISYTGSDISSTDDGVLQDFAFQIVENRIPIFHQLSGRVEAEEYFYQLGLNEENCFDVGQGKSLGNTGVGDYADYYVDVNNTALFDLDYRYSSESEGGTIELQLVNDDGEISVLNTTSLEPTGDWQNWETVSTQVQLPAGRSHIRMNVASKGFNLNWMEFAFVSDTEERTEVQNFSIYPNPSSGIIYLRSNLNADVAIRIHNILGQLVLDNVLVESKAFNSLDISDLDKGVYFVELRNENTGAIIAIEKIQKY